MKITEMEREYLLINMMGLLDEYGYTYTEESLNKIIDEWNCQKAGLIEAFKKHPNYMEGKFMIAFDTDYERKINKSASYNFGDWVCRIALPIAANNFPQEVKDRSDEGCFVPWDVRRFFNYLDDIAERCVSEATANYINSIFPEVHIHPGQKTSRVVNKICCYLGIDKVDGYNKEFAKYADSLSPLAITRHTVLSINPLDYLTMSFGNSWASCHTIDKANKRRMPNDYAGCYSSGTISYMLDPSSMVLYTIDASYDGDEYWSEPKINRQMFHYGEEKLVQSRLYPQENDGCGDVYTPYRNIVQNIISTIFDFPNLWTLHKGSDNASQYIISKGTHYRDYYHYGSCSLSRIKGSQNCEMINVGANPICINCGERHNNAENINHCGYATCEECGCVITNPNDVIEIDGETYCRDCVRYCEYCNEYHREIDHYVDGYGYVCQTCLNHNFSYCERCGAWVNEGEVTWIESEDRYVCDDCLERHYSYCEDCENYFPDDEICHYEGRQLCEECYYEASENRTEENDAC